MICSISQQVNNVENFRYAQANPKRRGTYAANQSTLVKIWFRLCTLYKGIFNRKLHQLTRLPLIAVGDQGKCLYIDLSFNEAWREQNSTNLRTRASYICCISLFCFVAVYRSFFEGKYIGIHCTHVLYGNMFDAPIKSCKILKRALFVSWILLQY